MKSILSNLYLRISKLETFLKRYRNKLPGNLNTVDKLENSAMLVYYTNDMLFFDSVGFILMETKFGCRKTIKLRTEFFIKRYNK